MDLAEECYLLTARFPKQEMFGMSVQIRRASVSVAANIAEGYGRETTGAYLQFLRIAQGSLKELETHILLAERVGLVNNAVAELLEKCDALGRMLRSLIRSVGASARSR
jgi:four helix bundle protein